MDRRDGPGASGDPEEAGATEPAGDSVSESAGESGKRGPRLHPAVGWVVGVLCVIVLVAVAGIVAHKSVGGSDPREKLTIIAPANPGGGWDLVARTAQQSFRENNLSDTVNVVNVPGAGGIIGLAQLAGSEGDGSTMMVTGTVMMGGIARNPTAPRLADMTPVARLAQDFEVVAVPKNSPYQNIDDFITAWRKNPSGTPIGGGSAGGIDHMVAAMLAREAGIPANKLNYAAYDGGGDLTLNLISVAEGTPGVGISGFNDFRGLLESGELRALMVIAPERLEGVDAPTAAEAGFGAVDLVNWRGFLAPPGLSVEQRDALISMTRDMVGTEQWMSAVEKNRWEDSWLEGDEFRDFLIEEQKEIDVLMDELGLT